MNIYYISPSVIPSKSANSIHVVYMCEALVKLGHKVTLFGVSNNQKISNNYINDYYGINSIDISLSLIFNRFGKGVELSIAIFSIFKYIIDSYNGPKPEIVIARNLYAAIFLSFFFKNQIIYETHSPEYGFRRKIQKWLVSSSKIYTVVISKALKQIICKHHNCIGQNIFVFHDAARAYDFPLNANERREIRKNLLTNTLNLENFDKFVGYFGHLYEGRGIEIIQSLALKNKQHAFIVYGGNDLQIKKFRSDNNSNNIFFLGHIPPNFVQTAMSMMDILLMPYQSSVSIGIKGIDTSKWMSPIKMFEYMSFGVPIISSDLKVLREVLINRDNAILVKADDIGAWSKALKDIVDDPSFSKKLGNNAYDLCKSKYTWRIRANSMINLFGSDEN